MAEERLDIVIFGASDFIGKRAVREAERLAKDKNFTWGVAGRRKEALESVLKEFAPESENIRVIIADLKDEESLKKMTEQAKILVNTCGPYRLYGEPVVKACIATRTHHVDVSSEPQYMEKMQLEYNKAAQEAGIYVVSACGYNSIPADLGIIYTQNKFGGEINSVETYVNIWFTTNVVGPILDFGTWESAVYGMAYEHQLSSLRSKLYPQKLPKLKPTLKSKGLIHRSAISEGWSTISPGSDRSVCLRTQRFFYEKYKQRPAQIQCYMTFKSLLHVLVAAIFSGIFFILVRSACGRSLLLKYPKFFSYGLISHEGPNPDVTENTHISMTFISKGWTEKMIEPTDQHKDPPNKEMITKITTVDPGYGTTTKTLLMSAITILNESDKMPENGGVLPPGAAFGKTSLVDELIKQDIKFEVISSIEN